MVFIALKKTNMITKSALQDAIDFATEWCTKQNKMRHIMKGSGLPETIQSIEEAIALLDKHNEVIADYINLFPALDEDDDFKAIIHYNSVIAEYLETLLNK